MRKSCFNAKAQGRRVFTGFFRALVLSVLCLMTALPIHADIETVNATTVRVETLDDLETALKDPAIETIIVKNCITLEDGTVLDGQTTGTKKQDNSSGSAVFA